MTDWKAVALGSIINAVLTIVLLLAVFPLFFLGPLLGGFLTAYLSREYPDFDEKMVTVSWSFIRNNRWYYNWFTFHIRFWSFKRRYRTDIHPGGTGSWNHNHHSGCVHHRPHRIYRCSPGSYWGSNRISFKV